MSEHPSDSNLNRFRASLAGALAFVSFGVLTAIVLGVAGFKTGADATLLGQFSPEQTKARWQNLAQIEEAQSSLYKPEKVEAALVAFKPEVASKTEIVVPMSETNLRQMAEAKAKADAEKAAADANTEEQKQESEPENSEGDETKAAGETQN